MSDTVSLSVPNSTHKYIYDRLKKTTPLEAPCEATYDIRFKGIPEHFDGSRLALPSVYGDGMVIQRDKPFIVNGYAPAGKIITGRLYSAGCDLKAEAVGSAENVFTLTFDAVSDTSLSYALDVTCADEKLSFKDILAGEVWFCCGQSNTQFAMNDMTSSKEDAKRFNYPQIRLFSQNLGWSITEMPDVAGGKWSICTPESVGPFSALGAFFGERLHLEKDVPVGLVFAPLGATSTFAWMPVEKILADEFVRERAVNFYDVNFKNFPPQGGDCVHLISGPYYGILLPLMSFPARGMLWYQGESNAIDGVGYEKLLKAMVDNFREVKNDPEMPFLFVQLPIFSWPEYPAVREGMRRALKSVDNTGMAVMIDSGDVADIHPDNKQLTASRLYLLAKALVYGDTGFEYSGALPDNAAYEDGGVFISFTHSDGLHTSDNRLPRHFELDFGCGFEPAEAKIKNCGIFIECGIKPKAVRYAWLPDPNVNLFNGAGLPASPFELEID